MDNHKLADLYEVYTSETTHDTYRFGIQQRKHVESQISPLKNLSSLSGAAMDQLREIKPGNEAVQFLDGCQTGQSETDGPKLCTADRCNGDDRTHALGIAKPQIEEKPAKHKWLISAIVLLSPNGKQVMLYLPLYFKQDLTKVALVDSGAI